MEVQRGGVKKALVPAIWAQPGRAGGLETGRMAIALLTKLFRVLHGHCPLQFRDEGAISMPILQKRELRLGKVK